MNLIRRLDLQAKISLVLVAVILPTFLIVTVAENRFTQPMLAEEIKQIGITTGKTLAAEIVSQRMLSHPEASATIEGHLQEFLYSQPNIIRIDVVVQDKNSLQTQIIASSVEEDAAEAVPLPIVDAVASEYKLDENGIGMWEIFVPIEQRARDPKAKVPRKLLGTVHLMVSMKLVDQIVHTLWRITATAAGFSVVVLILVLSYFLRKTISNDRLLRIAESQNVQLTEQLHDAQRQLMNTEKLAVMGQLTASFAHEIGTPLNAISGHLQLLKEELDDGPNKSDTTHERFDIINGQVSKIEQIVKNFLQSTAKPTSQKQLVDLNRLADQTVGIVWPKLESLGVEVSREFDRDMGPLRVVPLDLEQILLNLVNNSLDSLKAKLEKSKGVQRLQLRLELSTRVRQETGREWAEVSVMDTGEGIRKTDLSNVLKPFFTTKRPGEGTGLGLTICQQIARKYGGVLDIDSKEGSWTRVTLKIPYENSSS